MQALNFPHYSFRIQMRGQNKYIFDTFRKKYVKLTPEEWVRQHMARYLTDTLGYPSSLLAIEQGLHIHQLQRRADIVAYNNQAQPVLLVECKAPSVAINQKTLEQAAQYNQQLQVNYWVFTNGLTHYCLHFQTGQYRLLTKIPAYAELTS